MQEDPLHMREHDAGPRRAEGSHRGGGTRPGAPGPSTPESGQDKTLENSYNFMTSSTWQGCGKYTLMLTVRRNITVGLFKGKLADCLNVHKPAILVLGTSYLLPTLKTYTHIAWLSVHMRVPMSKI